MGKNTVNDFLQMFQPQMKDTFTDRPLAKMSEFYLSGNIESADNYIEWFDAIRHAGETDIIRININSYGGDLFTAIQFMRVLNETKATVLVSVEGACMSAATMIFLCGNMFEVSAHSMFMFHNYSGGTFGKGGEMLDQLQHERSWSEKLLKEIYTDFLDQKEIDSMLNNKDIWMDGDEVIKRLEKRAKKNKVEIKETKK
jgi:ATP-dependent protease ClpP protease subunit